MSTAFQLQNNCEDATVISYDEWESPIEASDGGPTSPHRLVKCSKTLFGKYKCLAGTVDSVGYSHDSTLVLKQDGENIQWERTTRFESKADPVELCTYTKSGDLHTQEMAN
jgi:hypothetical protein